MWAKCQLKEIVNQNRFLLTINCRTRCNNDFMIFISRMLQNAKFRHVKKRKFKKLLFKVKYICLFCDSFFNGSLEVFGSFQYNHNILPQPRATSLGPRVVLLSVIKTIIPSPPQHTGDDFISGDLGLPYTAGNPTRP